MGGEEPCRLKKKKEDDESKRDGALVARGDIEGSKPVDAYEELLDECNSVCEKNRSPEVSLAPRNDRGVCLDCDGESESGGEILIDPEENASCSSEYSA